MASLDMATVLEPSIPAHQPAVPIHDLGELEPEPLSVCSDFGLRSGESLVLVLISTIAVGLVRGCSDGAALVAHGGSARHDGRRGRLGDGGGRRKRRWRRPNEEEEEENAARGIGEEWGGEREREGEKNKREDRR
ncbi:uncharacterized protein J3R85_014841 [Psidium guajava]|nr:uncharacterized protein J3R85_014841 [Psidium guajava]